MRWSQGASKAIKEQNEGRPQHPPRRRVKDWHTSQRASSEPRLRDHPPDTAELGVGPLLWGRQPRPAGKSSKAGAAGTLQPLDSGRQISSPMCL